MPTKHKLSATWFSFEANAPLSRPENDMQFVYPVPKTPISPKALKPNLNPNLACELIDQSAE